MLRIAVQRCGLRVAQRSSSGATNLADNDHKKFIKIKGKYTPNTGQENVGKTLQMVRGTVKGVGRVSPPDEITHTGQSFDGDDYRRNRFIDRKKLVNPNWGMDMVAQIPPIEIEGRVAICDGTAPFCEAGPLGHPKVYINLDKPGIHSCPYCGLRFIQVASKTTR